MFYFNLRIPFIEIKTELMNQCYEKQCYRYIAWYFSIWKWHWILDWGKSKEEQEGRCQNQKKNNRRSG